MTLDNFKKIPKEQAHKFVRDCSETEFEELCKSALFHNPLDAIERQGNESVKSLLKLIIENPALPVVMFVATDVVGGDEYGYWLGHITTASVGKVFVDISGGTHLYGDDIADVLNEAMGWDWEDKHQTAEEAQAAYDGLPWKDAIAVYIEPGTEG